MEKGNKKGRFKGLAVRIVVYSRYKHKPVGFGISIEHLIINSFKDIGVCDVRFVYDIKDLCVLRNSVIIWLIKIGNYKKYMTN